MPVFFIDPDFIKTYSSLNGSVLEDYFPANLLVAQDMHIQNVLGDTLYNHLKTLVTSGDIDLVGNADYKTLLDDYIKYPLLWWFCVETYEDLYIKIDNGGLKIRTSEDTTSVSRFDVEAGRNQSRDRAKYYTELLIKYLCNNSGLYPEYGQADLIKPRKDNYKLNISSGWQNEIERKKNDYFDCF